GKVEEEVTVTAAAPLVDTRSTEISTNIDSKTIQSLPLGRTYASLIALAPGVAGGRLNAGGNQQDNVFLYDGSNVTNPFFANLFSSFSELDIQEINIKRGAVSAEFGRAIGMVTNAITKSGTNELSGSLRFVYEPANWYAKFKDPTIVTKTDVIRPSFGFGGPFIKDKLWWYLSANFPYSKTTGRVNRWGPVPDSRYPTREFFFKANVTPHPKIQFVASIRNSSTEGRNAGIGVNDNPSCATNYKGTERIYYFSGTWVISPNSYLEIKYDHVDQKNRDVPVTELGYKPSPFDPTKLDRMGYFLTVPGYLFGAPTTGLYVGAASMYNTQDFFRDELKLVFTQYLDFRNHSHIIKAGFGYDNGGEYLNRKANGWGSITYFSNIAAFVGGVARPGFRARYMPEGSTQKSAGRTFALFVQDTVTIAERITLYLGVLLNRDEYLTFGKSAFDFLIDKEAWLADSTKGKETRKFYFDFMDEVQPRLGFTLILDKKSGDKLYGNFGRYYALDNKSIARAAAPKRIYHIDAYFEITGEFVREIPSAAETGKVILSDIKPTYQDEFIFGYSRPLFRKKWVIDLWSQFRRVKNVIEDYPLINYGKWAAPSRFVYSHVPWAKRNYRAFTLQLQKPFDGRWSLLAMYTWSKLWGNWDLDYAESLFYASSALDDCPGLYMTDPNREGILLGDRTHIAKVFLTWEFWKRTTVGLYCRYQSGAPWQAQGRSWWYANRTYLEKAGSRRVDPWTNFDLQLSHVLPFGKFNGVIEARIMNLFNNQAVLYVDPVKYFDVITWDPYTPTTENPNFGKPTSYASPRRFVLTFYINF
ncbi:MAG: hypothetical protein N3B16_00020, partial [Candidatus Aminicenantes bacterium]|nr:hypothetical protein [Candidatus Aminicenantes bacterium]